MSRESKDSSKKEQRVIISTKNNDNVHLHDNMYQNNMDILHSYKMGLQKKHLSSEY